MRQKPAFPISAEEAIVHYREYLAEFEVEEILKYFNSRQKQIHFLSKHKKNPPQDPPQNT